MSSGSYDPKAVERDIYAFWEQGGYFRAVPNPDRRPYVIDIPLPNITGALHIGHALNNTIQDMLIRHHRMRGYETLWMPGTDHAGIATQAVVERKLKEEQGLTRHELGREGLVKKIWEWREEYGGRILEQLRALGASLDWLRMRFTLDEVCARAVYEVFFRWFKEGLIYRGLRLVNWDAFLQTAVADDEIVHETVKGSLWHYRYPILEDGRDQGTKGPRDQGERIEGSRDRGITGVPALDPDQVAEALTRAAAPDARLGVDYLVIATTRPETMLGDSAIAVHPNDPRWQHLIGRYALLPLMNRPIPIIADPLLVSMEFGTGCVKVTPAHDPNDYAFAQRHPEAQLINILTPDGKINENGRTQRTRGEGEAPAEPPAPKRDGRKSSPTNGSAGASPSHTTHGSAGASPSHAPLHYDYSGLDRYEARKRVVADLEALGLMEKIEPYETEIGHSDRSKTPIEPMLSEQWFVKMADLAETAMEAVRDGRVRFFPERYAKTYLDWLGEKRDWCISRQLWWGHRIPVWRWPSEFGFHKPGAIEQLQSAIQKGHVATNYQRDSREMQLLMSVRSGGRTPSIDEVPGVLKLCFCPRPDCMPDFAQLAADLGMEQDPDVLDTWFSSALWPFSTLGWPDNYGMGRPDQNPERKRGADSGTARSRAHGPVAGAPGSDGTDLAYFYPTSVLVTAREIITLWVARMVITGLHFLGRVPFSHVHIHPNIQDGQGRRMSKSLGNGVDPLDIIQLYGTDALRFTMVQLDSETQDARLPVQYLCPHCCQSMPQLSEHLGKAVVKCKHCKQPFATRLGTAANAEQHGLGVASSERFEMGRNFCNKIWQAATGVVFANLTGRDEGTEGRRDEGTEGRRDEGTEGRRDEGQETVRSFRALRPSDLEPEDRWILARLRHAIERIDSRYATYQLNDVAAALYDFFWGDFCDWYLELVKPRLFKRNPPPSQGGARGGSPGDVAPRDDASARVARQVLVFVLDQSLRLMHPVLPFISEALWQQLNQRAPRRGLFELADTAADEPALIKAAWPDAARVPADPQVEREIAALQNVIRALRDSLARVNTSRSAAKQPAIGKLPAAVIRAEAGLAERLADQQAVLERLGRCEKVEIGVEITKPPDSATQVLPGVEVYVPVAGLMDLAAERKRLGKELEEVRGHIERLAAKLANAGFTAKAPAAVVLQERARLAELQDRIVSLERNMAELS